MSQIEDDVSNSSGHVHVDVNEMNVLLRPDSKQEAVKFPLIKSPCSKSGGLASLL